MSFAGETKGELCRTALNRKCCTQAEAYGVLLYCNTFSGREIRIITENEAFAQRLPILFRKAFRLSFDPVSYTHLKMQCVIAVGIHFVFSCFLRKGTICLSLFFKGKSINGLVWTAAGRPAHG